MKPLITIFFFVPLLGWCQNLVVNPSFEEISDCPELPYEVEQALGWSSWRETPDYFNACSTTICDEGFYCVHVPNNIFGYQQAATGNGYMGIFCYGNGKGQAREIFGGQLAEPLQIGQEYLISFKVSLNLDGYFGLHWTCNKIGLRFSNVEYDSEDSPVSVDNMAHVFSDELIIDTLNWTTIEGSYIAEEEYLYFGIGNFFDNANTDTLHVNAPSSSGVHFFIDDVCISPSSSCDVSSSVDSSKLNGGIRLVNNTLLFDQLIVEEIYIFDLTGRVVRREWLQNTTSSFDVSFLNSGSYVIQIRTQKNSYIQKFIK